MLPATLRKAAGDVREALTDLLGDDQDDDDEDDEQADDENGEKGGQDNATRQAPCALPRKSSGSTAGQCAFDRARCAREEAPRARRPTRLQCLARPLGMGVSREGEIVSAIGTSGIVFACIFGATLLGLFLR